MGKGMFCGRDSAGKVVGEGGKEVVSFFGLWNIVGEVVGDE